MQPHAGFGAGLTPTFGTTGAASFGNTSAPALSALAASSSAWSFGASAPAFGASSTPAFASSAFSLGNASTPAFGASAPAFGVSGMPPFGGTATSVVRLWRASRRQLGLWVTNDLCASLCHGCRQPGCVSCTNIWGAWRIWGFAAAREQLPGFRRQQRRQRGRRLSFRWTGYACVISRHAAEPVRHTRHGLVGRVLTSPTPRQAANVLPRGIAPEERQCPPACI